MPQANLIRRGEARTVRLIVRTLNDDYLNLKSYLRADLYLYNDRYDRSSGAVALHLSTTDPAQAIIVNPEQGTVEFYMLNAQTTGLQSQQYYMRFVLTYNATHAYVVGEQILDVKD
jgi:hypothetical protein